MVCPIIVARLTQREMHDPFLLESHLFAKSQHAGVLWSSVIFAGSCWCSRKEISVYDGNSI